jgi:hypothetical protein
LNDEKERERERVGEIDEFVYLLRKMKVREKEAGMIGES